MRHIKTASRIVIIIALAGTTACASMLIGTQPWFDQNSTGKSTLSKRASFDMSCPEAQLTFACLGAGQPCESVGVSGCEKKATYLFVDNSAWVMNSTETNTP